MRSRVNKLLDRVLEIQKELDKAKPLYREMDELVTQLSKKRKKSFTYRDRVISVVDNYAKKNTVFKTVGIRRFDISITDS